VLSDAQLIDRMRSSLKAEAAGVAPPADLLARVRREYAAERQGAKRWVRPPSGIPSMGGVVTALAAGSAVALTVLAIVLLGHGRPTPAPGGSAGVPAGARQLVSMLAVLRRPQTAADGSLPAWAVRGLTFGAPQDNPVPSLTRLVATLPGPPSGGVRIFVVVQPGATVPSGRPGQSGDRVTALAVSQHGEDGTHGATAVELYQPVNVFPGSGPGSFLGPGYNVGIVPDGVTRVRWVFDDHSPFARRRPITTVYPTVRDNVAIAPIVRNAGNASSVTWYGADGRIIKALQAGLGRAQRGPALPFPPPWKLVAQINLLGPTRPAARTVGIADVFGKGASRGISVAARGVAPNHKGDAYAVWLHGSRSQSKLLGFVNPGVGADGRLSAAGALPPDAARYDEILVTLETRTTPKIPGKIVLQGTLRLG
jgi:hypothetical protein